MYLTSQSGIPILNTNVKKAYGMKDVIGLDRFRWCDTQISNPVSIAIFIFTRARVCVSIAGIICEKPLDNGYISLALRAYVMQIATPMNMKKEETLATQQHKHTHAAHPIRTSFLQVSVSHAVSSIELRKSHVDQHPNTPDNNARLYPCAELKF